MLSTFLKQFRRKPVMLKQSCLSLSVQDMIDCMIYGKTKQVLTISGRPNAEQLKNAWLNVLYGFENIAVGFLQSAKEFSIHRARIGSIELERARLAAVQLFASNHVYYRSPAKMCELTDTICSYWKTVADINNFTQTTYLPLTFWESHLELFGKVMRAKYNNDPAKIATASLIEFIEELSRYYTENLFRWNNDL